MRILCGALARDMDVCVLVPSRSRRTVEEAIDDIQVVRVAEFGRYASAPLCPSAPWWLRRMRPDLVHVHFPNPMGDLTYLASGLRTPLVVTHHADIIKQRAYLPYYRPVIDRLFRRASRIIASSEEYVGSSDLLTPYGDKTVIVPYGVDIQSLAIREEDKQVVCGLRREHGDRIVLFVGALRYYKGLDVLMTAMTSVKGRAVIVGRGSEQAALVSLAQQLGVGDRVHVIGEVPEARLRALYHAADV